MILDYSEWRRTKEALPEKGRKKICKIEELILELHEQCKHIAVLGNGDSAEKIKRIINELVEALENAPPGFKALIPVNRKQDSIVRMWALSMATLMLGDYEDEVNALSNLTRRSSF